MNLDRLDFGAMCHNVGSDDIIKLEYIIYHFFLALFNNAFFLARINHHKNFFLGDIFLAGIGVKAEHTDNDIC